MITGLLIIVHVNYLGLRHMNHGLTLIVSFFSFVQTSFREFGVVGSDMYSWGIKDFPKCWSGSLAKRRLPWARRCNKLRSTICIVLLSECVSHNGWLQHWNQEKLGTKGQKD